MPVSVVLPPDLLKSKFYEERYIKVNETHYEYRTKDKSPCAGCQGTSKNPLIYGVSEPTGIGSIKIGQYDPLWMRNAPKLMLFDPSSALFLDNRRINP